MGVLAVGVLGAASLLPIATYFQNETTNFDRGSALAQQAFHDLQIKNYLSPRRWVFIDPSNSVPTFRPEGISGLTGTLLAPNPNYHPNSAFVIDPLGFSYAFSLQDPSVTFPCYFPAFPNQAPSPPGGGPFIYRAGVTSNDYWPPAASAPLTSPMVMTFPVADRYMRSTDDLNFTLPDNTDLRPQAVQYSAAGSTAQTLSGTYMPDFNGDFSWIATVSRTPSDMVIGPAVAASLHRFQVAVVVLQKRDLTLWPAGLTPQQPPSERQVYAMFTQYGGQTGQFTVPFYGGGGLQLYVYEGANPTSAQPNRHWLDNIKANTYLMLTANFQDNVGAAGFTQYPVLAWYRIVNVADGPNQDTQNAARWYRNVTVTGGDWPAMWFGGGVVNWSGADPNAPNGLMPLANATAGVAAPVAFCTLMDSAVGEYDGIVNLNYSLTGSN